MIRKIIIAVLMLGVVVTICASAWAIMVQPIRLVLYRSTVSMARISLKGFNAQLVLILPIKSKKPAIETATFDLDITWQLRTLGGNIQTHPNGSFPSSQVTQVNPKMPQFRWKQITLWTTTASNLARIDWSHYGKIACVASAIGTGHTVRIISINLPAWLLCLLLGTPPVIAYYRGPLSRWRRRRKGLCLKCGYNLSGNESGICPECGTDIKP